MSSSERGAVLGLVALAIGVFASACSLGDDACIRMSDCDDGLSCVEGTCLSSSGVAARSTSTASDASAE